MSRAYRIRVSESLDRVTRVEDGVVAPLEILDVLPRPQMAERLAAALEARGFSRAEDDPEVLELAPEEGVVIRVNVREGAFEARASGESRVALERTGARITSAQDQAAARTELRQKVKAELEAEAASRDEEVRRGLTRRLEDRLLEVRPLVDQAISEATAEALKVRAGQLGEIEEIDEDPEAGRLVIRVKV